MNPAPRRGTSGFRFLPAEIAEMERTMQKNNGAIPLRSVFDDLAQSFTSSRKSAGKTGVVPKQVKTWFNNRRHYGQPKIIAGSSQATGKMTPVLGKKHHVECSSLMAQPSAALHAGSSSGTNPIKDTQPNLEAKSAKDGAWYGVDNVLSHRTLESGDVEVMVHFSGLEAMDDEWVDLRQSVRRRSLPCRAKECVAVLCGDSVLCLQERKEQAIYFDARVIDAQRRSHDVRGCRCTFVVRYEHDNTLEIDVPLRKLRVRPEHVFRLQILASANDDALQTDDNANSRY